MNSIYEQAAQPQQPQRLAPYLAVNLVQGDSAANARHVAAGTTDIFFDSEKNLFYAKTVDFMGIPQPLRYFEYNEIFPQAQQAASQTDNFATKEDVNSLKEQIEGLKTFIEELTK